MEVNLNGTIDRMESLKEPGIEHTQPTQGTLTGERGWGELSPGGLSSFKVTSQHPFVSPPQH